jgi:hypothetical protein
VDLGKLSVPKGVLGEEGARDSAVKRCLRLSGVGGMLGGIAASDAEGTLSTHVLHHCMVFDHRTMLSSCFCHPLKVLKYLS